MAGINVTLHDNSATLAFGALANLYAQSEPSLSQPSTSAGLSPAGPSGFSVLPGSSTEQFQKRRSSSRSIKRKKFDDELVESSLVKTSRSRPPTSALPVLTGSNFSVVAPPSHLPSSTTSLDRLAPEASMLAVVDKKKPRPAPKRVKKTKTAQPYVTKDIGRWKPADDLVLIYAVQQLSSHQVLPLNPPPWPSFSAKSSTFICNVNPEIGTPRSLHRENHFLMHSSTSGKASDLKAVFQGVKFSCKFTIQEIRERWYTLLYDTTISKVAFNAMKQLHPDVIAQIQSNALYSELEEKYLCTIPSTVQATVEIFQELLDKNPDAFLPTRTAKALLSHWTKMKNYTLLPDQSKSPVNAFKFPAAVKQSPDKSNSDKFVATFSDAEELIQDAKLQDVRDDDVDKEMRQTNRVLKKEVRLVENEIPKWQVLVDSITGVVPADFDNQTLAVLKGRYVRYLMRSREITIGRVTKDHSVDIDLSLEGPSCKVSRKQGLIKLENNGDFTIVNEGRRPFYVDGKPITTGNKFKLNNNSVLEIISLRFLFLINQELINAVKSKAGC